jgi:hypothetical protein
MSTSEQDVFGLAEADGSLSRFYFFAVLTVVLAIFLVFYLFFSSRLIGYVISLILNALLKGQGQIRIGSLHIGLLGGKICVRDFVYCSKNISIRVVDGYIAIQWWKAWAQSTALVLVSASGLEYCILNNSGNYDK